MFLITVSVILLNL